MISAGVIPTRDAITGSLPERREDFGLTSLLLNPEYRQNFIELHSSYQKLSREKVELRLGFVVRDALTLLAEGGDFRTALESWETVEGINAGVLQYFQYRADPHRNKRYQDTDLDKFSCSDFIEQTRLALDCVRQASTGRFTQNNRARGLGIQVAKVLKDDGGQYCLVQTKDKFILSTKREGEAIKLQAVIPLPVSVGTHLISQLASRRILSDSCYLLYSHPMSQDIV